MTRRYFIALIIGLFAGTLFAARKGFVCKCCGACCRELVKKEGWRKVWVNNYPDRPRKNPHKKIEDRILKERIAKYPPNDKGCEMLFLEGDKQLCFLHRYYKDRKPKMCVDYPAEGKLCLREQRERK